MPPKQKRTEAERERQLYAAREKALYTRQLKQSRRLRGELAAVDAHIATYETELGTQSEAPAEPSHRGPAASAPTAVPLPGPAPTPGVAAVDAHIATYETELGTQPEAPAEPSYRGPAASAPTAVPPPGPAPTPGVSAPPPPTATPAPTTTAVAPPCALTGMSDAESVVPGGESWMSDAELVVVASIATGAHHIRSDQCIRVLMLRAMAATRAEPTAVDAVTFAPWWRA